MDLKEIIKSESLRFIANQFHCAEESISLNLDIIENPMGLFPREIKNTYVISGNSIVNEGQKAPFNYFVKVVKKNELLTNRLLMDRINVIPRIQHCISLNDEENVFLMYTDYVQNTGKLWFLLNSLRIVSPDDQKEHHEYAKEVLAVLGRKIAAMHFLLSEEWLRENSLGGNFRKLTEGDLKASFHKGMQYIKRKDIREYLNDLGIKPEQQRQLEEAGDYICQTIMGYPFKCLLHGDMQISNIIWDPQKAGQFYFIDWNHAHIGPALMDIYTFQVDFGCDVFLDAYLELTDQLHHCNLDRQEIKKIITAAVIHQSLRLASESIDLFDTGKPNDDLKDSIQITLIRRVFETLQEL